MSDAQTNRSPEAAPAAPARSPFRRRYLQPAFVAAVVALGAAAVGLNAATQALQVHFKKQAVPLRVKLDDPAKGVGQKLGPWVKVTEQVSLDPDVQHELGTDQFVFRQYVDTRVIPKEELAAIEALPADQKGMALLKVAQQFPNAVVDFQVVYYTGLADRVTHIPDRCMIAGGYRPASYDEVTDSRASFALPDGVTRRVPFRFINFEDETGRGRVPTRVIYFFQCNGRYDHDPQAVRASLQNLLERHGYYAKVELKVSDFNAARVLNRGTDGASAGSAASLEAMRDLIGHALPDIERCLPDWAAVKAAAAAGQ